jgi:arylsulfatase
MQTDRLSYAYNWVGLERYTVTSTEAAPSGSVRLRVEFTSAGPNSGTAALFINDKRVGEGRIARLVPITFGLSEGLTIGRDPSTPVTESYQSPFEFTGTIKKVVMELKEDPKQSAAN